MALFFYKKQEKEEKAMAKCHNSYQSHKSGVIKAPKPVKDQPKATVTKGNDLRNGKKTK